jgi:5-formyltetrahydrofolate cyclo-ligase
MLLKTQKEEDRDRKSRLIKQKLLRTREFIKAKRVMFYMAFCGEVNTEEMMKKAALLGKTVTVPVCERNRISIRPCRLDAHARLRQGPYGVKEPAVKKCISADKLDLVIVPGVAFDPRGNRLGRGKGYYDRFLEHLPKDTPSIGLAFDFQILPKVPAAKHDVKVNKVLFA